MQPQYGQPAYAGQQPVYAQPAPGQPPYGQPGAVAIPDIKWSGLKVGGAYKIPLTRFIGRFDGYELDTQSTFGVRVVEKYSQVQVLETTAPWPWATADVSIKYADSDNSAWGRHVGSAKTLGLALAAQSLQEAMTELVGRYFELVQAVESYGENQQGQPMTGDVWRFVRLVQPGATMPAAQPVIQPAQVVQPIQVVAQPVVQPVVDPALAQAQAQAQAQAAAAQAAAVAQPAPVAVAPVPGVFDTTLLPTDTPALRAKKLLQGRALNEFLGVALIDDIIKGDGAFLNSIFDQSLIVGLKSSGQVVQDAATGVFTVLQ